jgi:uncharacterized protein (DUF1778 family)
MTAPISIRLDSDVRETLETEARIKGVGLSTYLRDLAKQAARDVRRARNRADSERVAAYIATNPEAKAFFDDWGTPTAELQ